jgi:hypothetical protein
VSVDDFIDELSGEATEAVRRLLRQAYDRGFREALASAGQPAEPVSAPAPTPAPAPVASPVAWTPRPGEDADDQPDAEVEDDDNGGAEVAPVRPILPLATIGTLRHRIVRTFDLERFDIDVVICRSGDPDRRQLRSSARLGLYRREER